MTYILFFVYLLIFCWLLIRIKFIYNCGIDKKIILLLFLIKVAVGLTNGFINLKYYPGNDIYMFHQYSLDEYHLLFKNPHEYFSNLFKNHTSYSAFLETKDSFWNNLRTDLMIKLLSVFNIFSGGNFFINTIFYNFLVFFGSVSFFRIFYSIFPDKKFLLIIGLFLLPSFLFFTSGIYKDGLIFLGLGTVCYHLFSGFKTGFSIKKVVWVIIGIILIILLRNFIFITLIPALIAWIIAEKTKKVLITFSVVYLCFIVLFFNLSTLHPKLDLPHYVSDRQISFVLLSKQSNSAINVNPLFPNFRSFLNNAPQALNHSLMRPYLTETSSWFSIPLAIEILVYEIIFLLFLFFRKPLKAADAFMCFGIFLSLSMFLMIGYTIPIMGAIVRYRSIYFPLLITPLLCLIDFPKLKQVIY